MTMEGWYGAVNLLQNENTELLDLNLPQFQHPNPIPTSEYNRIRVSA